MHATIQAKPPNVSLWYPNTGIPSKARRGGRRKISRRSPTLSSWGGTRPGKGRRHSGPGPGGQVYHTPLWSGEVFYALVL